ncbi:MAG: hypothetical protein AB7E31_14280 [Desulfitobacterium sp.]
MFKKAILCSLAILMIGIITFLVLTNYIPSKAPLAIIKYNNLSIPTVESMNNWFDEKTGGNSRLSLPPEENTKELLPILVEPNSNITIGFDTKFRPKMVEILQWKNGKIVSTAIIKSNIFTVPSVPGIYVYEIIGKWNDTHNSAHSFRIEVKN